MLTKLQSAFEKVKLKLVVELFGRPVDRIHYVINRFARPSEFVRKNAEIRNFYKKDFPHILLTYVDPFYFYGQFYLVP